MHYALERLRPACINTANKLLDSSMTIFSFVFGFHARPGDFFSLEIQSPIASRRPAPVLLIMINSSAFAYSGSSSAGVYVILSGWLSATDDDGMAIADLTVGDYCGELTRFFPSAIGPTVRAPKRWTSERAFFGEN